ncbi:hypothetical protein RBTH_09106 [Bacillus thuringiensis serovar israelensis ATCC 35646]|nr:hypothetical protein RBTH_09106 [Bacillus thuringiensis serovar israelensis ATCC 35646]
MVHAAQQCSFITFGTGVFLLYR